LSLKLDGLATALNSSIENANEKLDKTCKDCNKSYVSLRGDLTKLVDHLNLELVEVPMNITFQKKQNDL